MRARRLLSPFARSASTFCRLLRLCTTLGWEASAPPWETSVHWTHVMRLPARPGRLYSRAARLVRSVPARELSMRSMVFRIVVRSVVWRQDSRRSVSSVLRAWVRTVVRDWCEGGTMAVRGRWAAALLLLAVLDCWRSAGTSMAPLSRRSSPNDGDVGSPSDSSASAPSRPACLPLMAAAGAGAVSSPLVFAGWSSSSSDRSSSLGSSDEISIVSICELWRASVPDTDALASLTAAFVGIFALDRTAGAASLAGALRFVDMGMGRHESKACSCECRWCVGWQWSKGGEPVCDAGGRGAIDAAAEQMLVDGECSRAVQRRRNACDISRENGWENFTAASPRWINFFLGRPVRMGLAGWACGASPQVGRSRTRMT